MLSNMSWGVSWEVERSHRNWRLERLTLRSQGEGGWLANVGKVSLRHATSLRSRDYIS
jgi:hypothetical protein